MGIPALVLLLLLLVPAPATGAPGNARSGCGSATPVTAGPDGAEALVIGDSITVSAAALIARDGYAVDARSCRAMPEGLTALAGYAESGLPALVVVALGSNGTLSRAELDRALALVGPGRILGLITPVELGGGESGDARLVRSFAAEHAGQVELLDWSRHSRAHPEWFGSDGLHLSGRGQRAFADFVTGRGDVTALPPAPTIPDAVDDVYRPELVPDLLGSEPAAPERVRAPVLESWMPRRWQRGVAEAWSFLGF